MEKSEIERVRYIHSELDKAASQVPAEHEPDLGWKWRIVLEDGRHHDYTATEIRAWPKMKAALVARLEEFPDEAVAVWDATPAAVGGQRASSGLDPSWPTKSSLSYIRESGARGLCLYREMLATPAEAKSEAWVEVDRNEDTTLWRRRSDSRECVRMLRINPNHDEPEREHVHKLGSFRLGRKGYELNGDGGYDCGESDYVPREPAPSAPAKAEFPTRAADLDLRRKPDPYRAHTDRGTDAEMLEHERLDRANTDNRPEAEAARLRNITALRRDLDLTTAQRRSRLGPSKHDARERDLGMAWQTACWEDVG